MSNSSPPELLLENQICFAVYSAAHAFAQAYKPHLDPMGLTYPQYLVMLLLWEQDGRSVNALGQPLHLDSGTLTPLLKRMEKAGLVTRQRDAKDERIMRIHLTDHGRALRERARAIPPAMLCASGLELEGLMALHEEVKALGRNLREK
ncbi:MarR family transcriptional regulator [Asticcacaulis sp.]|uniref:MarR family winged helix-turn-helix transcriptional regulator n=1 Tax=Asticcacaulis sp. TaxID=1872648 RepID=UPI002BD1A454|nr:MarR family transcriptional regulator [Asticcacaulis sp.]HTM81493.1 MarR family transcriptional regulator [Asticcacaulis sp.]